MVINTFHSKMNLNSIPRHYNDILPKCHERSHCQLILMTTPLSQLQEHQDLLFVAIIGGGGQSILNFCRFTHLSYFLICTFEICHSLDFHLGLLLFLPYILYKFYHNHLYNVNVHLIRQSLSKKFAQTRTHARVPESSVQLNSSTWVSHKPIRPNNSKLKAFSPTTLLWFLFMFY